MFTTQYRDAIPRKVKIENLFLLSHDFVSCRSFVSGNFLKNKNSFFSVREIYELYHTKQLDFVRPNLISHVFLKMLNSKMVFH